MSGDLRGRVRRWRLRIARERGARQRAFDDGYGASLPVIELARVPTAEDALVAKVAKAAAASPRCNDTLQGIDGAHAICGMPRGHDGPHTDRTHVTGVIQW